MAIDPKFPILSTETKGVLGYAEAFDEAGEGYGGHLAVDAEGHVVFIADHIDEED